MLEQNHPASRKPPYQSILSCGYQKSTYLPVFKDAAFSKITYNTRMSQSPLFTIGYGARDIDEFIAVLKENEIAFLLDVRSKPYSRYKPAFSKKALADHLKTHGIRYVFMGDTLGGMPEDPTCYTNGNIDYEKVAKTDFFAKGIGRLQTAYRQQQRV
ncbi:MAG: DUF488 domain-containing protein, partial [Anaerolineales bacterium]|nr:DUF488 domain-containing protein [Anaerolineales bacterium]